VPDRSRGFTGGYKKKAPQPSSERRGKEFRRMSSVVKKVMFVGRATVFMVGLAVILALTVGLASTALAGTGVGAPFNLGQTNTVDAISKLVGSVAGPSLQIDNNSTNAAATALDLQVEAGKAPMKVSANAGKATNLDADKVDGKDSSAFVPTELYVEKDTFIVSKGATGVFSAFCDPGDVAISGGYGIQFEDSSVIAQSRPDAFEERWLVELNTGPVVGENLAVYVRCADFPPLRP
jgi:hypothetical protein